MASSSESAGAGKGAAAFHVVHLTAECWSFAHTGGLGMVVSGLARSQAAAGVATAVVVPLSRSPPRWDFVRCAARRRPQRGHAPAAVRGMI